MRRKQPNRRGSKKKRKKRKATPGSFKPGPDPRRHKFTTSECRVGYWVTMLGLTPRTKSIAVRDWVRMKVCIHNRIKNQNTEAHYEESDAEEET